MKKVLFVILFIAVCLFAGDITYDVYRGWNNISVPCNLYGESLDELFPYTGYVFRFNSESMAYDVLTTVPEPQHGFWMLFEMDTTITFECDCINAQNLNEGIYICDWYGHRVVRINDIYCTEWLHYGTHGTGEGQFDGPIDCKVGPDGKIYIADRGNNRIVRMDDMEGYGWTTTPSLGLHYPRCICFDESGRIYIADVNNNRIIRINDLSGDGMVTWGSGVLNQPNCVAIDGLGRILITDTNHDRIVRIDDMSGTGLTTYGTSGTGTNQFDSPRNIDFDSSDRIYITDRDNHRIVRIDDMTGTNWISYGTSGYLGDVGTFGEPDGISIDRFDNIYIGGDDWIVKIEDMTGTGWVSFGTEGSGIGMFNHTVGVSVNY